MALRALHCVCRLGRHVVLIVLGQHFLCAKHTVCADLSLRNDAFAFLEQVREDTCIQHRQAVCSVRHYEAHCHAVGLPLHATLLH